MEIAGTSHKCNANRTLAREQQIPNRIEIHAFLVMYNRWMGAPCSQAGAIMGMIQEIKRSIVYRRCTGETTNRAIHCNRTRMLALLLITVKKMESLRKYQGIEMRHTKVNMM
jgi:hypothetical protein